MAATIITIAQQKGGAGKTTLAAQLAIHWLKAGLRVGAVDIDPQGSLSAWHALRQAAQGPEAGGLHLSTITGWRLGSELDRLRGDRDVVLVDTPPHAETDAKTAIRAADLVLVPVQPSPMDLWATAPTLEVATKERRPALVVLNRMPARGKLKDQILAKIAEGGLPCATAIIGNRVGLASSMMDGKGIAETSPRSTAAREIAALAEEALAIAATAIR